MADLETKGQKKGEKIRSVDSPLSSHTKPTITISLNCITETKTNLKKNG